MKKTSTLAAIAALTFAAPTAGMCQIFTGKPTYKIETKRAGVPIGDIHIELFPLIAPLHTANFDNLVNAQFYDSTAFHRVIPGFMIQGGDPNSRSGPRSTWGQGQPGQPTVNAEFSAISHQRGIMSAARLGNNINSATSQFFIMVAPALHLDGNYSAYGRVTQGMSVVDNIVASPRDANDNPHDKVEMFITRTGSNDVVPVAPVLVSPANGFMGGTENQAIAWDAVSDAAMYTLEVSTDPTFATTVIWEEIAQHRTTFNLYSLLPGTQYYWRMNTNNGGHLSPWSGVNTFNTGLAAPTLVSPPNDFNGATNEPLLEWDAVTGADSYSVQVARNANFIPNSIVVDTGGVLGTSLQLNNLLMNTRYYWRVRPQQNGNNGFFSPTWNFRVTVLGTGELADNRATLQVHPNPAAGLVNIDYALTPPGQAQLRLLDINGRQVALLEQKWAEAGEQQHQLNTNAFAPGIYLLQLTTGTTSRTQKLVIVR